jgi:nucleotide-binding universal stress UspA family protein
MYTNILIPLDGSDRAEAVLARIGPLLSYVDAKVTLLAVVEYDPHEGESLAEALDRSQAEAEQYLEIRAEEMKEQGINAHAMVRRGNPADEILSAAEVLGADLIAMSSHGHSGLTRLIRGSVAEKVLRSSTCPVFVLKSYAHKDNPADPYQEVPVKPLQVENILVPLDGSKRAEAAIDDAITLAKAHQSAIHLLEIRRLIPVETGYLAVLPVKDELESLESYLEKVADRIRKEGVAVTTTAVAGHPTRTLLDYLESNPVDLIAMTTHGRTGLKRWIFGSVAESVLRQVHIPILLRRTVDTPGSSE